MYVKEHGVCAWCATEDGRGPALEPGSLCAEEEEEEDGEVEPNGSTR